MPGSPRRIFRNFTTAQIQQLIAAGFDRAIYGQIESLAGQNHSSTTRFDLSLSDLFFEANFELGVRGVGAANPPQVIYQDFSGLRQNTTVQMGD